MSACVSTASLALLKCNARQTGATGKQGAVGALHSDLSEGTEMRMDEKGGETKRESVTENWHPAVAFSFLCGSLSFSFAQQMHCIF